MLQKEARRNKVNMINNCRLLSRLLKIFWCTLLIISLGAIVTACAEEEVENMVEKRNFAEEESENIIEEQNFIEEINPTFLNLEYMYSIEDIDLSRHGVAGEFTWYEVYDIHTFEDAKRFISRDYGVELSENIDLDSNSFIAISIGRGLQKLYYFEESRYDTFNGQVFARPVFEREYSPNTIFVYRVTPLPQYSFICHRTFTDDFGQLNIFNNIPFEVWDYDGSIQTGGPEPEERPFQRENDNWQRPPWQEFEEVLSGYINVQEADLRSMSTRNSIVIRRLSQGDELIIYGYTEDGEDIDGNSRWYYVRTSMDSSNQVGYIHSSFVTVISSADDK